MPDTQSKIAPLQNILLCNGALKSAMNRPLHLPGLVVFSGPAGFGKSVSAAYAAVANDAHYVQAKSTWYKKDMLTAFCKALELPVGKTMNAMIDAIGEELSVTQRPFIVDEADHIVDRKNIELIRDIYEGSQAAIMLIGEEKLPNKLQQWERIHSRVLDWCQAQPVNLNDTQKLVDLYAPEINIDDDLLAHITDLASGSIRRIVVNIENIRRHCQQQTISEINKSQWGNRQLYTGKVPKTRSF
jgi:DNA transposition AAA+ family ATPase